MADNDQELMWNIHRAAHFEWRRAALKAAPGVDPVELVKAYWREVGEDTGKAYVRAIDKDKPIAPQVAALIVRSSEVMGETAHVTDEGLTHTACPWKKWHERSGLLHEDQPGCDAWLESTLAVVNTKLGCHIRFETLESLPEGGTCCRRRVWED